MPKIELLNPKQHNKLKIKTGIDANYDDIRNVIAVVAGELPQLVLDFPVFFTRHPETKAYELVAVAGFSANENLFIDGNKIKAAYVPLDIRRQPFQACFGNGDMSTAQENDVKIGLNVESNRISETEGSPLFKEDDSPSLHVNEISELLGALVRGIQSTQSFIAALEEHSLIEPITLNIKKPDGSDQAMDGLFAINKQKLAGLKGEVAADFHERGYLQAAHAMIHSIGHVQKLVNWKVEQLEKA